MTKALNKQNGVVRCVVIGIGSMGKKYALMLDNGHIAGLTLVAVCCRSNENAKWAESNLAKSVKIFRSEDELYKDATLFDAVLIVTPHRQHPAMAIRALNAGKHVMCDKPAGITVADGEAINQAASLSNRVYAMMCHQRTFPEHVKIKQLLDSGAIGQITRVSLESSGYFRTQFYHRSASWRSSWNGEGGGALINQGYHLLDLWQYLFGLPTSVYANIPFGKYNDFAVDDEATIIMSYTENVTGTFILTTGEGASTDRLTICGTKGRILLENKNLSITRFSQDTREYSQSAQVTSRQDLQETTETFNFENLDNAYEIMLENFANAISFGEQLIAPGIDSARTLELVNAAYLSAWQNRKVYLPIDMREYLSILHEKEAQELSDQNDD